MNGYKKIIKSQETRLAILRLLRFVPDKIMIKLQYRIKTGKRLNLQHPKRYTEKLQWYKLYYRNPLLVQCADKYAVREYVTSKGYGRYLNNLLGSGVYMSADEIDFDALPNQFVIKATHGSGTNEIVLDKASTDIATLKEKVNAWLRTGGKSAGREWCYEAIKPRLIVEEVLEANEEHDLPDYKFFCFDGKVYCLYVMQNYTLDHSKGELGFYDRDFSDLHVRRLDFNPIVNQPPKPKNFEKMVEIAEALSAGFPHVRVDFYNVDGKITFGEMTFYNASGYTRFEPDEFDFELGEQFVLPER